MKKNLTQTQKRVIAAKKEKKKAKASWPAFYELLKDKQVRNEKK